MSMPNRFALIERRLDIIEHRLGIETPKEMKNDYNDPQDTTYIQKAVDTIRKNGGCGKTFPKKDGSGSHGCTCGFNKWNYLCPECEIKKEEAE